MSVDIGGYYELNEKLVALGEEAVSADVPLAYLLGQTAHNQSSVLDWPTVNRYSGLIAFVGEVAGFGYPGGEEWSRQLVDRSVGVERQKPIMGALCEFQGRPLMHTLSEMEALVKYLREHEILKVAIIAPRWHIMRAYLVAVHVAERDFPHLHIHPRIGVPLPWDEEAKHSQGVSGGIRADFMWQEALRWIAFAEQGNLASPAQALKYLERFPGR